MGKGKGDDGGLRARELEDGQLPSEGWQWWDREAWRVDSATITISPQASTLCQRFDLCKSTWQLLEDRLELGSKRASETEETNCLGIYKPLCGSFCRGRQVAHCLSNIWERCNYSGVWARRGWKTFAQCGQVWSLEYYEVWPGACGKVDGESMDVLNLYVQCFGSVFNVYLRIDYIDMVSRWAVLRLQLPAQVVIQKHYLDWSSVNWRFVSTEQIKRLM